MWKKRFLHINIDSRKVWKNVLSNSSLLCEWRFSEQNHEIILQWNLLPNESSCAVSESYCWTNGHIENIFCAMFNDSCRNSAKCICKKISYTFLRSLLMVQRKWRKISCTFLALVHSWSCQVKILLYGRKLKMIFCTKGGFAVWNHCQVEGNCEKIFHMILGMESITLEITKYRKISYIVSVRWLPKRRKKNM